MIQTLSRIALIAAFAVSGAAYAQKANETSNVPQRAGEASTMTGGNPNAVTDNERLATNTYVDVYSVPSLPYSSAGSMYYGS